MQPTTQHTETAHARNATPAPIEGANRQTLAALIARAEARLAEHDAVYTPQERAA